MPGTNLTREEAQQRANVVTVGSYDITLDITGKGETFFSCTKIHFTAHEGSDTFIDLIAPKVRRITINGIDLPTTIYTDGRIPITKINKYNEVIVEADCKYMNTGEGLHRFIDPVDQETYLYTQFEVADSRRVFAVFEQPDLKSSFTFHISAPKHWQVFSNSPTPEPSPVIEGVENADNSYTWHFSPTEHISSYLTAIVAGPYQGSTSYLTSIDGRKIPLGVYCRASLAEHLDADEIIDMTVKGFRFYEEEFSCPYPFRKYDQIFVPEFNAGAMENAGCVTIVEDYVFRSRPNQAIVERRAITVLHELAHMWFGDLVTMKWWNDLWLNESFAEFMSHLCAADATRWTNAWVTFLTSEKSWGVRQDQLPSTHPIVSDVTNLEDVWINFDGITYAKGASVLKQLVAYVGRKNFMTGIANYFHKHAWGNTVLGDLLSDVQTTSGVDIHNWSNLWLETSGINLLRPQVHVDEQNVIQKLEIIQELGNAPTIRPHCLGVAFYELSNGRITETFYEEVRITGEKVEIPEVVGMQRPALVLLNAGDLAYAKIRLDAHSWNTALAYSDLLSDDLARNIVLSAAWDMCRDGEAPAREYIRLALRVLASENSPSAIRVLISNIITAASLYSCPENRQVLLENTGSALLTIADQADPGSEIQFQAALAAAKTVKRESDLHRVQGWLKGENLPSGFTLDTDARWQVIVALAAAGLVDDKLINDELAKDNTSIGFEKALLAKAAIPTTAAKEEAFQKVMIEGKLPNAQQRHVIMGFTQGSPDIITPFFPRILNNLEQVWNTQTYEMAQSAISGMYPFSLVGHADLDIIALTEQWLVAHPDLPTVLRRIVNENLDNAKRILRNQTVDKACSDK